MNATIPNHEQNAHHKAFWSHKLAEAEREARLHRCIDCGDWHDIAKLHFCRDNGWTNIASYR